METLFKKHGKIVDNILVIFMFIFWAYVSYKLVYVAIN